MIDLAVENCKDHHICVCQKIRLEKAEWTAETAYKAWLEKRDQVTVLETEVAAMRATVEAARGYMDADQRRAYVLASAYGNRHQVEKQVVEIEAQMAEYWRDLRVSLAALDGQKT